MRVGQLDLGEGVAYTPAAMGKEHLKHSLAAFLLDTAVTTGMTAMPFFIYRQLGGDSQTSGTIGGLQSACYAIVCLVSSPFLSRSRNGMVWGIAGCLWFMATFPMAPLGRNLYWFGALSIFCMAGMSLVWPALQAWIGAEPDVNLRGRRMGVFNLSWNAGFALGPIIGGVLYDAHYACPFVAVFVLTGIATLLIKSLPHEKEHFRVADQSLLDGREAYDRKSEAQLYAAWVANFVGFGMVAVMRSVFPKRVEDLAAAGAITMFGSGQPLEWNAPAIFSSCMSVLSVVTAALLLGMGYSRWWRHKFWLQFLVQAGAAIAFWGLGITQSLAAMLVCAAVVGLNCGVCFVASQQYSVSHPTRKHARAAIHEGVNGAGGFIGSIVFGYLGGSLGVTWPFLYTPIILTPLIVLQGLLLLYGRRRAGRAAE